MFRLFPRRFYLLALAAIFCSVLLPAQETTGRVSGRVTDLEEKAIPGATVQVVNQETLVTREARSDGEGSYAVHSLPAGRYQIIVEADGFSRRASEILTLAAGQVIVFNAKMTIGEVKSDVEVTGG